MPIEFSKILEPAITEVYPLNFTNKEMKTLSNMYPGEIRKSVKSRIFLCKFKVAKVAVVVDILFELPKSLEALLNVYKDFSLQAS